MYYEQNGWYFHTSCFSPLWHNLRYIVKYSTVSFISFFKTIMDEVSFYVNLFKYYCPVIISSQTNCFSQFIIEILLENIFWKNIIFLTYFYYVQREEEERKEIKWEIWKTFGIKTSRNFAISTIGKR